MPFPLEYKFIRATEDQLGFKFPEKYKAKMQIDNGGEINIDIFDSEHESDDDIEAWWLFPFQDTSDIKKIKRTMNHLSAEHQSISEIEASLRTVLQLLRTVLVTIYYYKLKMASI